MYAETLGIPNPSPAIETAATWVQWSLVGVQDGANREQEVRYNLDQFWKVKAAYYPNASNEERGQLERLDTFAHGVWDALETGNMFRSTPSYWEFLKSAWFGGTPVNKDQIALAAAAARAQEGQRQAATRASAAATTQTAFGAGLARLATQNQQNLPGQLAQAQRQWSQPGIIPSWAWIMAAGVALLLILDRK